MKPPFPPPPARTIVHDAMHTTFTLRLMGDPPQFDGIVRECILLIDELESRLSRFMESSEICRINRLQAGETLYISDDTHRCLLLAAQAHADTGGLFDITLGRRIARRKAGDAAAPDSEHGRLILHPEDAAITCESPGRELDLGGIGKGFALDRLREMLLDWEIPGGLLASGASTLLAFGPDPWPVELAGAAGEPVILALREQALSASGTESQGSHLIHPDHDGDVAYLSDRVWTLAPTAAVADAWSTALALMTRDQANLCLAGPSPLQGAFAELDGRLVALPAAT